MKKPIARHLATSLWTSALLLIVAYPGDTLLGGSLAPSNLGLVVDRGMLREPVPSWPDLGIRKPSSGVNDLSAALWQHEPAVRLMARALREGRSIAWNPWSATGMPGLHTAADVKTAPRTLVGVLLGGGPRAQTLATLVTVLAGLVGVQHLMGWYLGLSRLAALASAAMFLLNGFSVGYLVVSVADPFWWFPWFVIGLLEACRGGAGRIALAAALEIPLLAATFLPVQLLCAISAGAIVLALPRSELLGSRGRRVLRMASSSLLAVALLGVVLVPLTWGLLVEGDDLSRYASRNLEKRTWADSVTLLTPRHVWDVMTPATVPAEFEISRATTWLGLSPLIVIAAAWRRIRPVTLRNVLGGGTLLALLLHLGVPVVSWLALLPPLRPVAGSYWPAMAMSLVVVLVGLAVDTLLDRGADLALALAAVASLALLFGALFAVRPLEASDPWLLERGLVLAAFLAILATAVLVTRWRAASGTMLLVAVLFAELASYPGHSRQAPFDVAESPTAYLQTIRDLAGADSPQWRILSLGNRNLYPEWGAALGLRQLGTLNIGQSPWYRRFYHLYVNENRGKFLHVNPNSVRPKFRPSALDLASVRLIAVDQSMEEWRTQLERRYRLLVHDRRAGVLLYENAGHWPRARLVDELATGPFEPKPFLRYAAWSEDEGWVRETRRRIRDERGDPGGARIVAESEDAVSVEVRARRPAVLVLADAWHPGWKVFVDGEPAEIARVDLAFRGVVVPQGISRVEFRFRPLDIRVGMAISLLALLVWVAMALAGSGAQQGPAVGGDSFLQARSPLRPVRSDDRRGSLWQ